jgi:hypothetical protein
LVRVSKVRSFVSSLLSAGGRAWGVFLAVYGLFAMSFSQAMADTDISQMVEDSTTVWTAVKGLLIAIVAFFLLLSVVTLVKRGRK